MNWYARAKIRDGFKREAERAYAWLVDIEVPPTGLGSRIDRMGDWCRGRLCQYEMHGHVVHRPGQEPLDLLRFYFAEKLDAVAFVATWGGHPRENPRLQALDKSTS